MPPPSQYSDLTDPSFLSCLESLYLLARKVIGGELAADRRSNKRGSGIHFADYAEYQFGDDYRQIDWKIYARLENLFLKLYELEEDVSINILLDISPSMEHKLAYASKLAAALGYIALSNQDRLSLYGLSDRLSLLMDKSHGKGAIMKMLKSLAGAQLCGSNTSFSECIKYYCKRNPKPSVLVVISDFFFPSGYDEGLKLLRSSKNDVFCLQVLDPSELSCDYHGDVEIECVESAQTKLMTLGPLERKRFAQVVQKWNEELSVSCARHEMGFLQAFNSTPFEEVVQVLLRRGGLVS
ncbi:MAG: DUF58 domain-containing protein [Planctomycetes bacterium]|nr:DUF58 domain-containing protein [Planctomycetota bacterium]